MSLNISMLEIDLMVANEMICAKELLSLKNLGLITFPIFLRFSIFADAPYHIL